MNLENDNAVRAVARTAQTQHGVFTTSQAVALGMLPSTVRRRMTMGYYQEVYEGVFVIAGGADSWRRSLMAAVLSEEVLAAASHQTAAYLLGLVDRRGDEIHVVTRRWLRRPRSDIRVHESTDLIESDIVIVDGIPTTDPTRTVVDLGATARWLVPGALGNAVREGMTSLAQVDSFIARVARRGRRGVGVVRPLISERRQWENRTESQLEDEFTKIVRDFDLPAPMPQFIVRDESGGFVCRVDFAYADHRVLIELDGFAYHGDEGTFQSDRTKQNRTQLLGWSVLRYTWRDVLDRPGIVAAEIRSVLA